MKQRILDSLRNATLALGAASLLAAPASATWSIVAVDLATGEVVVATATCLQDFDLQDGVPVITVGLGAAATQGLIHPFGANKQIIFNGFQTGMTPQAMLDEIEATDGVFDQRVFGIVDFVNDPVGNLGNLAEAGKKSVVGTVGTIRYAIQGSGLTGPKVVQGIQNVFKAPSAELTVNQLIKET